MYYVRNSLINVFGTIQHTCWIQGRSKFATRKNRNHGQKPTWAAAHSQIRPSMQPGGPFCCSSLPEQNNTPNGSPSPHFSSALLASSAPDENHHGGVLEIPASRPGCSPRRVCIGIPVCVAPWSSLDRVAHVAADLGRALHAGEGAPATWMKRRRQTWPYQPSTQLRLESTMSTCSLSWTCNKSSFDANMKVVSINLRMMKQKIKRRPMNLVFSHKPEGLSSWLQKLWSI
jgi:hypothetical protein